MHCNLIAPFELFYPQFKKRQRTLIFADAFAANVLPDVAIAAVACLHALQGARAASGGATVVLAGAAATVKCFILWAPPAAIGH